MFDFLGHLFGWLARIVIGGIREGRTQTDQQEADPNESDNSKYDENGDSDYPLSGGRYRDELQALQDRNNDWLEANGYDRASGLDEEIGRIQERHDLLNGTYDVDDKLKTKSANQKSSLLDDGTGQRTYHYLTKDSDTTFQTPEYQKLYIYAVDRGYTVSSTIDYGQHNKHSAHYQGRAIDVRTRNKEKVATDKFILNSSTHGIRVRDERVRPPNQEVWKGPHIHLQVGGRSVGADSTDSQRSSGTRAHGGTRLAPYAGGSSPESSNQ